MYEPPSRDRPLHPLWRFLAILVFAGLFALGVAMVFHHPGRQKPGADEASQPPQTNSDAAIPIAESVEEGLTFTDEQRELISAVRDNTSELSEPGFYLLLRHTASLPKLSDQEMTALASPSYTDLLEYPSRYRARPLRMRIYPKLVKELTPGSGLGRSLHWPGERPVWRIDGLNASGESPINEPVVVFSVVDPTALLGEPTSTADDGRMLYEPDFTIEVAGVFYKVWTAESRGDEQIEPQETDYPVVLSWQLRTAASGASRLAGETLQAIIMFVVVALLVILFFYMRHRTREQPAVQQRYRPRRRTESDSTPETREVDPELRAAAEDTEKHRTEEDADRQS